MSGRREYRRNDQTDGLATTMMRGALSTLKRKKSKKNSRRALSANAAGNKESMMRAEDVRKDKRITAMDKDELHRIESGTFTMGPTAVKIDRTPRDYSKNPDERPIKPTAAALRMQAAVLANGSSRESVQMDYSQFGPNSRPDGTIGGPSSSSPPRKSKPAVSRATLKRRQASKRKAAADAAAAADAKVAEELAINSPRMQLHERVPSSRSVKPHTKRTQAKKPQAKKELASPGHVKEKSYMTSAEASRRAFTKSVGYELKNAVRGFESNDWQQEFDALDVVRSVALQKPAALENSLHSVILHVLRCLDNLRSNVSKNATFALNDMFAGLGRGMDPELETVTPPLLKRACDTNVFLGEEAEKALVSMIRCCNENRVITALLLGIQSKNARVRAKTVSLIDKWVEHTGPRVRSCREIDRVIRAAATFLEGREPEIRSSARRIILRLHRSGALDERAMSVLMTSHQRRKVDSIISKGNFSELLVVDGGAASSHSDGRRHRSSKPSHRRSTSGG